MNPAARRMPVYFFGHGSPMNALELNDVTRRWRQIGAEMLRPRAILCISAHWERHGTATAEGRTIHDFRGFPQALYEIQYPAPGSAELARRVGELLAPVRVEPDPGWGLDHGTWSVLIHVRPDADVPVVQLSLDRGLDAEGHYQLARRLIPLRDEGVLVIGSGNVVHNLARLNWGPDAPPQPWATRFDAWVQEQLVAGNHAALTDYQSAGDDARLAVPTPEHYLPLLYCIALQQEHDALSFPTGGIWGGTISMRSLAIEARPGA